MVWVGNGYLTMTSLKFLHSECTKIMLYFKLLRSDLPVLVKSHALRHGEAHAFSPELRSHARYTRQIDNMRMDIFNILLFAF